MAEATAFAEKDDEEMGERVQASAGEKSISRSERATRPPVKLKVSRRGRCSWSLVQCEAH